MERCPKDKTAYVVFTNQTDLPWLKILRPGFRHCFVIWQDKGCWISLDPMSNHMEIISYPHMPQGLDVPEWFEKQGHIVVSARVNRHHKKAAPVMLFTCVEAVKRVLGIHKWSLLTPWQLYRFLIASAQKTTFIPDINKTRKGEFSWEA